MAEGATTGTKPILVVDLDGTLIASDMLYESLWSALSHNVLPTLKQVIIGPYSRAAIKRRMAELSEIDIPRLPYERQVLDYIDRWRAEGGRVALVTAADEHLAHKIADHVGLFDEVFGSDGDRNLKGATKAAFLTERFGPGGYVYIGDTEDDLPVWAQAQAVVTVNAGSALAKRAEALGHPTEHIVTSPPGPGPWLRALRPHQWLKNILVFLPMIAGHAFTFENFAVSFAAFVVFCLVASSVYITNDLLDLSADRAHPRKCARPFAAGHLPIAQGSLMAPTLLGIGLALAAMVNLEFLAAVLIYFATTVAYSTHLKQRTIIDIWVLAVLYSLRLLAGAAATGIVPSVWLLAFSIFFFFSLAAVKRQAELVDLINRDVEDVQRRGYHRDDVILIAAMAISSGYVSILVMALYIRTPFVESLYSYPPALLGICLVLLYWISRIVMVTHRGEMHDDPLVFALRDRISQLCVLVMAGAGVMASVL
ncbi:MAG: UbiA family prenyltransferase [Pseudomonadota bacterium]